jgi:hypothetical protein
VLAALAVLSLSGCSGSTPSAAPAPSPSSPAGALPSPATASTPPATTHPSAASGVPSPGSMARPATTSGPLSQRSFPTPRRLGPGWRYAVDPGDAEEGYAGNGTPALARNPTEIVQTAVPLGCARPAVMPAPAHALEVDYTHGAAKAIAVRGTFADRREAAAFFAARTSNLRGCQGRSGSQAIGPLVGRVSVPLPGTVVSDRTPDSDPWREVAVLDRDSVVLLAVQGAHPLTDPQTRRLVAALRR